LATEETKPRQTDIADYIRIIQKRKWFIGLVGAAAIIVGGLYAVSTEPRYRATALVLVRQQPRGMFWISGEAANMMPTVAMETYARIARNVDVAKHAAEQLGQLSPEEPIIVSAQELRAALEVTVIEPDLLRIDATSPKETKAMHFANQAASSFVDYNTEMRRTESQVAREFLEDAVAKAKADHDSAMQEAVALSRRVGMVDVEAEAAATVTELRHYEDQRRQTWADLSQAQAEVERLQQAVNSEQEITVKETPAPNPAWSTVKQELTSARITLSQLQARYTEGHPAVQEAEARVQELEDELADTPEVLPRPEVKRSELLPGLRQQLVQASVRVAVTRAGYDALNSQIATMRSRARELPENRQQWQALADRTELARSVYQNLRSELQQAELSEAIKVGNALVVDTADIAVLMRASFGRALVFAGVLGLFSGLGLALLLEALDDTISTPEELARISDVRFLGVIPLRGDQAEDLVAITAPKSPPAEAYRTLRSNIRFSLFDEPARSFVVCSAGASEGKSLTAANLAVVCAQGGDSVILVDTDLRRPVLHRFLNCEASVGLTNMLVGEADLSEVLQDTEVPGLRLLPSGPLPPNPAELLDSDRMTEALEELCSEADIVILDSPPAIMLTDAGILASKADRTIIVAESGQITERAFNDLTRLFEHARANVLGVVLNKLRVGAGDYYYYYYYYYDYGQQQPTAANGS